MHDYFAGDPRTNRERMLAGDLYIADDPESLRIMHRAMTLTRDYAAALVDDIDSARSILSDLLGSVGDDVFVRPPLHVDFGENIHLGDRVSINFNLTALDVADIRIGDDVLIGPNVQLLTATHPVDPRPRRDKLESAKPITIHENVWIGGGAIIGPGVTIGENSVIGAGAVVLKDVPANVIAAGNPARILREIPD
ncbi:sugar O-acetyltransferase [Agromyces mangrovi Wang et al. 2018]|uniref:sugar O-acetyltransferase n=1 Tax=Agromyces mangrovi TaxID=1858653 RepID=UPI0025739717|nr:sugar O-acetyltransferase [Agromyces mangrovi]BDZ64432.1 maltose O-acetyltransferase [Agromyces mangrovi]